MWEFANDEGETYVDDTPENLAGMGVTVNTHG